MLDAANRCGREEGTRVAAELDALLLSVDDERERRALTKRFEERGKRAARRAEWDELRLAVDTIGLWYRDRLAGELGAQDAVLDSDRLGEPPDDAIGGGVEATLEALSVVLDVRRSLELNVHPALALEAMLHRLAGAADGGDVAVANVVGVVFQPGGKVYSFDPAGLELRWDEKVICQTSRGREMGG